MAFERLQSLGSEKFSKILNLLMRGEPAQGVARLLQQAPPTGWGEFQDVAEKTLTQQLNRLRLKAADGVFGLKVARQIAAGATPQVKLLEHVSISVIVRLEELSDIQKTRVLALVARESDPKVTPTGQTYNTTNEVVEGYRKLLLDIQKVRFNLGLDEFKGPVGGMMAVKGSKETVSMPDGTNYQRQVFEAVSNVEQIFDARKIPQLIARE